jgi:hypothetical protein
MAARLQHPAVLPNFFGNQQKAFYRLLQFNGDCRRCDEPDTSATSSKYISETE